MMTMTSGDDESGGGVPQPPAGAIDIRTWGIRTNDGLWVAAIAEEMHGDLMNALYADQERRYLLGEVVAQANRSDTPAPGDVGYPRYELHDFPRIFSGQVRLEGFGPDRVWIFYSDDPVTPPTKA